MSQTPCCPVDNAPLDAIVRQDVTMHACPQCRGIWIARAELDKIVAKEAGDDQPVRAADPPPNARAERPGFGGAYGYSGDPPHRRRRRGLLVALFG